MSHKPRTISATKNIIEEPTPKKTIEPSNDVPEEFDVGDQEFEIEYKDLRIMELQEQLDKAHLTIAYFQQPNRELRHKVSQGIIQPSEGEPTGKTSVHAAKGKSKHIIDVEEIKETIEQPRKPRTR